MAELIDAVLADAARLTAAGRPQAAIETLRPVIAEHPDHPGAWCGLAAALLDVGDAQHCLDAAKRAITLGEPAWAHRLASLALTELGRHEEAAISARESARRSPGDWRGYVTLAEALGPIAPAEALAAARRAVASAPEEPRTHEVLGSAAERAGDADAAREAYAESLRLDPTNPDVREALARLGRRTSAGGRFGDVPWERVTGWQEAEPEPEKPPAVDWVLVDAEPAGFGGESAERFAKARRKGARQPAAHSGANGSGTARFPEDTEDAAGGDATRFDAKRFGKDSTRPRKGTGKARFEDVAEEAGTGRGDRDATRPRKGARKARFEDVAGDAGRADAGRADAGRADAGRADAGRADMGRAGTGRADADWVDADRVDAGRFDAGGFDAGGFDAGRFEKDSARKGARFEGAAREGTGSARVGARSRKGAGKVRFKDAADRDGAGFAAVEDVAGRDGGQRDGARPGPGDDRSPFVERAERVVEGGTERVVRDGSAPRRDPRFGRAQRIGLWLVLRRCAGWLAVGSFVLLIAGMPTPNPLLVWFALGLLVAVAGVGGRAVLRLPTDLRLTPGFLWARDRLMAVTAGALVLGLGLLGLWSAALALGVAGMTLLSPVTVLGLFALLLGSFGLWRVHSDRGR
ncbi:tetratricopeptide repeat protein [Actinokineospora sp. 24-640]